MIARSFALIAPLVFAGAAFADQPGGDNRVFSRLYLEENNQQTPLHEVWSFTDPRDVCNRYGSRDVACKFAAQFYAGWSGRSRAVMNFTRFPAEPGRAHLYGADRSTLMPRQLRAIGGTLNIVSDGATFSANIDLSSARGFINAGAIMQSTLNASQPTVGSLTTSSIAPVTITATASINERENWMLVAAPSGTIYPYAMVCGGDGPASNPCQYASPDFIGQITTPIPWEPGNSTTGGPGYYALVLPALAIRRTLCPAINCMDLPISVSYGILTVGQQTSGTIATGQQIKAPSIPADTFVEYCVSGCRSDRAIWVVNQAISVSPENMTLFAAPLAVAWVTRTNDNTGITWGRWEIQHNQYAGYISTIGGFATGTAADALGLARGSVGTQDIPYDHALVSSPGGFVADPGQWLTDFRHTRFAEWESCQTTFRGPPGLKETVERWAQANLPIQCPASWDVTGTPPVVEFAPRPAPRANTLQ